MHLRSDHYGEYRQCFQCGNVHDVQRELPLSFRVKIQKGRQKPGRRVKPASTSIAGTESQASDGISVRQQ